MKDSVKLKILFPILGLLLVVLAAASIYSIIYSQKIKEEFKAVGASYNVINHLDNLVVLLVETEGNLRGYILSSNVHFLYEYEDNARKTKAEIAKLKALVNNNPPVYRRIKYIEELFELRRNEIDRLVNKNKDAIRKGHIRLTFEKLSYSRDLKIKIREEKNLIESLEKKTLTHKQIKATSTLKLINIAIIFSGISALVTALMIVYIFYREYKLQQRLKNELATLNESKNRFFSIVSHDLRGPINSALVLSTFLKDQNRTNDDESETIFFLHKSLVKIQNLLEILLKWAKLQMNELVYRPETFSIIDVVCATSEYLSPLFSMKKIAIDIKIESKIKVYADKNMVETILRNLISNAIKYSSQNDTVTIDAFKENGFVTIFVKDNGIGISTDLLPKLFSIDHKYSTKGTSGEEGTGLGLKLCKEFVEKNGGKIWVEKNETKGTTFLFTLPASY
ncbi:two-component system sensor histidine kinase [Sporocytophaga myxococcoides]|uniref:histidine kinase n=1 Tax=Sporocytophaga myxococcoides TaxID=153721 RepID=A0A098L8T5_9BACT|nr:ATP-binding protein [Sporocytophaga myxococcoides]GAL82977.1 two-component system sensor histidine kinase [Sporocytophaga myxococcoides]